MRQFVIPENFFKVLAEKPKLYSRLWFEWLSGYADYIFEPDFLAKIETGIYSHEEIREIWMLGVQLLRQGDFTLIDKSKVRKKVFKKSDPEKQQMILQVVQYLNAVAETSYLPHTQATVDLIVARMSEGYKFEDFKTVIDNKVADWKGTDWEKFLRPITLFSAQKFENYLNGKKINGKSDSKGSENLKQFGDSLQRAKQAFIFGSE